MTQAKLANSTGLFGGESPAQINNQEIILLQTSCTLSMYKTVVKAFASFYEYQPIGFQTTK
jgi:hypothetical protein